jgi:NAD(P)-dependent dehydrogenase (short-subunit alcohol dehydrogenase family)
MIDLFSLAGKNILVTGASSGIGKQIAITVASMGATVNISARNSERLNDTLALLPGAGHKTYIADLTAASELDDLAQACPELDGIVFSSGIIKTLPFKFITETDLDDVMHTNFTAPVLLLNKLLKLKKIKKNSSIVFISSIAANLIGTKGNSMYSASKGAIAGMQKVLALELAPQKIRVNSIAPGMVKTEMWNNNTSFTAEQIQEDEKKYPLGYGEPADVANAAIYLLSDASKWVTGISLVLDGGFTIQ